MPVRLNGSTSGYVELAAPAVAGTTDITLPAQDVDLSKVGAAWTSYTPVLTAATTNPTMGTSPTQIGAYTQIGKLVVYKFQLIFGTGMTAGSGMYRVSLPVTPTSDGNPMPGIFLYDSNAASAFIGCMCQMNAAGYLDQIWYTNTYGGTLASVGDSGPWTWAASDQIRGQITYEAA